MIDTAGGRRKARLRRFSDEALARRLDEETVAELERTSGLLPLHVASQQGWAARPAYDEPGRYRWGMRVCAAVGCTEPFYPSQETHVYCCHECMNRTRAVRCQHRTNGRPHSAELRRLATLATVRARSVAVDDEEAA